MFISKKHTLIRLTYLKNDLIFWCALPTFWSSTAADVNKTIPRNTSEKIPRTDLPFSLAWLDLFRLVWACLNSSLVVLVILQLVYLFRYVYFSSLLLNPWKSQILCQLGTGSFQCKEPETKHNMYYYFFSICFVLIDWLRPSLPEPT